MTDQLEENMIAHAELAVESNDAEEALASAKELASLDPKDAIVWFIQGKAYYVGGDYEQALAAFSQAATIQNDRPEVWLMIGYTLVALGRYADALPSLEFVKGTDPQSIEATCALCIAHTLLGHTAEAKDYLDQAGKINRPVAAEILSHFHEKFFSTSEKTSAQTKAMVERLIEKFKISR